MTFSKRPTAGRYSTSRDGDRDMMRKERHNIYSYIALKVLLAFGVVVSMQALFFIVNRHILHPESTDEWTGLLWGNVIFGMATLVAFLLPWLVMLLVPLKLRWKKGYRIVTEVLYIVGVVAIIVPRAANSAYYQFTYRLLSDEIFSYLGIGGQMGSLMPLFLIDYWYAWLFPLLILILFLFLNSRIRLAERKERPLLHEAVGTVGGALIVWLLLRGGFGPFIQPDDAAQFVQPKNTALVNNDGYNILRTLFTPELKEVHYMSDEEADKLCPVVFTPLPVAPGEEAGKPSRNVVLIVVESLGQEFMGCYNTQPDADTRTPFLDSLAQHSTLYDGRANGKKSIEGILALNTSIPNLMAQPLANSKYSANDFTGMPAVFKRHGYHTAFYHGSYNGVMDFDKLCAKIGFDEYLGKDEYESEGLGRPEDYDGAWGILDEPFLQYTLRHINNYGDRPFFAEIFTVSSHHPYPVPDEHKGRFSEGRHPLLKCVEYTDYSLRRFFEEARKQPWFDSTLFIITGDHSGQGLTAEYNDYDGWYRIPMMMYDPQHPKGSRNALIVQQIDLFPTLVDLFRFDEQIITFGNSIGRLKHVGNQVYFGNGYYCLVCNDNNDTTQHRIALIQGHHEEGKPQDLDYLKALIQQYNNRIINNKLMAL